MLAVVEHEQKAPAPQLGDDGLRRRCVRRQLEPQRARQLDDHLVAINDRAKLDEMDLPSEVGAALTSQLNRERRLAHAAEAGQCQQACTPQCRVRLGELPIPADQRHQPRGQAVRATLRRYRR